MKTTVGNLEKRIKKGAGNDLLSHAAAHEVPSALEGLTSEFGMESGVAPPVRSPAP